MSERQPPAARSVPDFVAEVIADPVLVARLLPIEDRRLFLDEVLDVAREAGYQFTAEDLEATMTANRRRWIERSLPW